MKMSSVLKTLLDLLGSFFQWRANAIDPITRWEKKHDKWKQELERLEDEAEQARQNWSHVVLGIARGDSDELWAKRLKTAHAIGAHRAREPKCPDCGH